MKVIAIKDAPIPERGYTHKGKHYERAYYKGDVFEIYDAPMFRTEDSKSLLLGHYLSNNYEYRNKIQSYISHGVVIVESIGWMV